MTMIFQLVVGLALIGASQEARSSDEIKALFVEQAMECNKEQLVSADEMLMMKDHNIPTSDNAKCLLACVMRKMKFINDKGNFDYESANAFGEKEYHDDPKQLEGAKKIYETCKVVNDVTVSDGEKGCDRAYHLTKCLIENAPKMGFPLQ